MNKDKYLKVSPYLEDGGHLVGKTISEIPKSDLEALGHPQSLTKVIRAKCIDCCGGDSSEVRKCVAYDCPLWPFRFGKNPFHAKAKRTLKE